MYDIINLRRVYTLIEEREFYDKNGNSTGIKYFKGDPIPDGYYAMVVMICLQNSKGDFLMQKRAPQKGGYLAVTGGHPKAGETPFQGIITEVREELGLDISGMPIELYAECCDGKAYRKMYYLKTDIDINALTLQKEEVSSVEWVSAKELEYMLQNNLLYKNQVECISKCLEYIKNK